MKSGTEAYWNQNYDAAIEMFQQATLEKPDNPISLHNLGTALYKNGQFKDAAAVFQNSLLTDNSDAKATIYYNLGNAQFQMHDFKAAIESYKSSLRLNPQDSDAKHNLALAQKRLKEQQASATQQQTDNQLQQQTEKNKTIKVSKETSLQLLDQLTKNQNKLRQDMFKQQLNTGYRREIDW